MMTTATRVSTRWMIKKDFNAVLDIEQRSFDSPWTEQELLNTIKQPDCIAIVAEHCGRVVGYMIYCLGETQIDIANIAVDYDYRRRGVGSSLVSKLRDRTSERRDRLTTAVKESNLDAQLFFRRLGFRAVAVLKDHYRNSREDAYLMIYRLGESVVDMPKKGK